MDRKELENLSAFDLGEDNDAFAKYFSGKSYLSMLNDKEVSIYNVTFEPSCRNNWHIHIGSAQILVCVGGEGWYQEEGEYARFLKAGDVVYIKPEIKHWHGATKDSAFSHLAISVISKNNSSKWCEEVSNEYYNKL